MLSYEVYEGQQWWLWDEPFPSLYVPSCAQLCLGLPFAENAEGRTERSARGTYSREDLKRLLIRLHTDQADTALFPSCGFSWEGLEDPTHACTEYTHRDCMCGCHHSSGGARLLAKQLSQSSCGALRACVGVCLLVKPQNP